tara:strand:+ start:978 stop:1124 length:147 start_codon:yes stop_codon:yes gene_type:complete
LYFKKESIKDGKKENSIKNPLPKIIKKISMKDDKIIVVIASIEIEKRI